MIDLVTHDVEFEGVRLSVRTAGPTDAPLLVLLHGWPESHRAWLAAVPHLADDFHLVIPDQRGFGGSDKPKGTAAYAMVNLVRDLAGLIEWAGAEKAALAGHDFGAAVTWAAGALIPDRITRAVALCAPHPLRMRAAAIANPEQLVRSFYVWLMHAGRAGERLLAADGFRRLATWAFSGSSAISDELRAAYVEEWSRPGAFHAMAEWYRANFTPDLFNPDLHLELPPVQVPMRYVHAGRDLAFVPEAATGSGEYVAAEYDEVVLDATHWVIHEQPEEVARLVRDWVQRR